MSPQNIHSVETIITQIPNGNNKHHAICSTRITTLSGRIFSAFGEAFKNDLERRSEEDQLCLAAERSTENAFELLKAYPLPATSTLSTPGNPPQPQTLPGQSTALREPEPRSGNPITAKQQRLIATTALHNGKTQADAEAIARENFGRSVAQLTTKEVNLILDKLRGQ
jgi:hypothetical protein